MAKFIFVTGGVVSGLGKGLTAASLGRLLKMRGLKVAAQKLDPYMNIDPGAMDPLQHGEVYVTSDGVETDLDLGHYERFIDEDLGRYSSLTAGKVYWSVLNKERAGEYMGETVQVIPHITGEIKNFIYAGARVTNADVLITEIGGTAGDIESQPFLEAIRQIAQEVGRKNCLFIHVTLVPFLSGSNEHKSKPTQHSVKELQSLGIAPDIIIARSDRPIEETVRNKIALFCNVKADCVIENLTLSCLYEAPIMLYKNNLDKVVCRELSLRTPKPNLTAWKELSRRIKQRKGKLKLALVGKYVTLKDAYLSIIEAISHASYECGIKPEVTFIDSAEINHQNAAEILSPYSAILVPGGSGAKGVEGKLEACRYARENGVPYFGLCLGMQVAAMDYARNVCGLEDADSTEFNAHASHPVVDTVPIREAETYKNGVRLGSYPCKVASGSLLERVYGASAINERHRHQYCVNSQYSELLERAGMRICGTSEDGKVIEALEIPAHPFFMAVQFRPEFISRPNHPHPLFVEFLRAAMNYAK